MSKTDGCDIIISMRNSWRDVTAMLTLVKLEERYMPQLTDMMDEWTASGEEIVP